MNWELVIQYQIFWILFDSWNIGQNDGDFYINLDGGFEGYLSRIRYYNYAIEFNEIDYDVRMGPDGGACIDTSELPPYFDDNWWFS